MNPEETKPVEQEAEAEKQPEVEAEKPDSEKTIDELKAEAEAAEKLYKENRGGVKEDELRANMIRRRDKAIEKAANLNRQNDIEVRANDIDTRDLITLGKADISEDSEQAKVLEKYKAGGIIKNYAEGLNHPAIRAEFDAISSKTKAQTVIGENDSDDVRLRTTKEVINSYKASGEIPDDPKLRNLIAENNLREMNI